MPVPYVMPVKNFSGEEIPPFAAMQIIAVSDDGFYLVQKPDTDGLISGILLNGPGAIPVTGNGDGHFQFPGIAHFEADEGDIPTNADTWGTKADSWYLWKDKAGFKALGEGTTISGTKGYFNVMADPASVVNSTTPFWIKITGQEYTSGAYTGKYSWVEQVESTAGAWTDKPSGRSSLFSGSQPGYEANLTNKVPIGKICLARMAEDGASVRFVWAMGPSDIDICVERTGASGASYVTDVKTRFGSGDCESAPDCSDVCASTPDESCVEITCGSDTVNVCRSLLVDITGLVDGDCDTCFPPTERIQIDYIPDGGYWVGLFSNSCTTGMFFYFGCSGGSWYWKITKDANTTGNQSFDTESLDPFEMEDSSYIDGGALGDSICPPGGGAISVRVYAECVCEGTVVVPCCPDRVLPRTLNVTVTQTSGTCDCDPIPGFTITWDEAQSRWEGQFTLCGSASFPYTLYLYCLEGLAFWFGIERTVGNYCYPRTFKTGGNEEIIDNGGTCSPFVQYARLSIPTELTPPPCGCENSSGNPQNYFELVITE